MLEIDSFFPMDVVDLSCSERHSESTRNIVARRFNDNLISYSEHLDCLATDVLGWAR